MGYRKSHRRNKGRSGRSRGKSQRTYTMRRGGTKL